MLTLALQTIAAVLKLVFVGVAVGVTRRQRDDPSLPASAWRWLAMAFLVSGVSGIIQAFWAVAAFAAGAGTEVYELYIGGIPAMNYSRFAVAILLGLGLTAMPMLPPRVKSTPDRWLVAAALAAALLGVAAGLLEGPFVGGLHHSRIAVLQLVETAVLFSALLVGVARGGMDIWLWLCLFIYGFRQALNALVWAATAWDAVPGAWYPPFWLSPVIGVTMWLLMIAFASRRLILARRGVAVGSAFTLRPEAELAPLRPGPDRGIGSAGH